MRIDLTGRTAVVTGGGKGIGAAIVRALAGAGAQVAVAGRSHVQITALVDEIRRGGGRAFAVKCDVALPDDVERLKQAVHREAGPAQIVVNNAGTARSGKFADMDEETWAEVISVNLTGAYRVSRAFWGDVLEAGARGRLLFIASSASKIGFLYTSAYCASKHGLLGLCRALAHEAGKKGPTVNCVCPGWVDTDMAHQAMERIAKTTGRSPEEARHELEKMNPQRRLMTPEEIAEVTLFLASDAARGVTGQGWNVDGGQVMS